MQSGVQASQHQRVRNAVVVVCLILATSLGILVALAWLVGAEPEDGLAALEGTSVDTATLPQTVPFRSVAGHLVVDAHFEGTAEAVPLILDTGAPLILSDDVAERFGGDPVGTTRSVAVDGRVISNDVVVVDGLSLGQAAFAEVGAVRGFVDDDNPLSCISRDGLVGASLMKEAVWQIDYDRSMVTIAETVEGLDHVEGALALGFSSPSSASPTPRVLFGAGDAALALMLDTGSDGGLAVNPADLAAAGLEVAADGPAVGTLAAGAAGTFDARVLYAAVDVTVDESYILQRYPVATLDSLPAGQGNIGNAFLSDFVVTIDWPNEVVYLDPESDAPQPRLPVAASLGWDGERVIVGTVVEGSAPAEVGLAVGQPVSAIDGRDVSDANRDGFCELLSQELAAPFELTTDGGNSYEIDQVAGFFDR